MTLTTYVHSAWRASTVLGWFVLASIPAAVIGIWNLGDQIQQAVAAGDLTDFPGWGSYLTPVADSVSSVIVAAFLLGLGYVLPLIAVALAVSGFWAAVFARLRQRAMDPGWIMSAWLFVLLIPPSVTPAVAALGMSFGVIVGAHIFGGSGRYLVSPALLGVLFIHFSYPEFAASGDWQSVIAMEPGSLFDHLLGNVPGTVGGTSALACLVGAALLSARGIAPWRILLGGVIGVVFTSLCVNALGDDPVTDLGWYWHLVVGNFAFALVFLATDPTAAPLTRSSRWLYGGLIGLLTVTIRTLDPSHPEGTLFAVLLASLSLPVIDYFVVRRYRLGTSA